MSSAQLWNTLSSLNSLDTMSDLVNESDKPFHNNISSYFGARVFNHQTMKEYLPESEYYKIIAALQANVALDNNLTESMAQALLKWALEQGATHFTHWFQPLHGRTAQKHDAFYKPNFVYDRKGIEQFSAAQLIKGEADASSFPNGGLRNTAQARGITLWDPSSPPFILHGPTGNTLFIPAFFMSHAGEALDYKTPLVRSIDRLNETATKLARFFQPEVKHVYVTLGWEQEYFLIDKGVLSSRPDLIQVGRTLFGAPSAQGQALEDHYFGAIPERVQHYMQDLEYQAHLVGIPLLTRHNEVAPGQYECAPRFEELNIANDHNQLLMLLMEQIAEKHGFIVIFHEKPFATVNGSGKHNNWSLSTDKARNLLAPSSLDDTDLAFYTFFILVLAAIEQNGDLLRAAIASAGNDHRLGANEAPPAIISAAIGDALLARLTNFETTGSFNVEQASDMRSTISPVERAAEAPLDTTDRNRTSPFPFTGDKFEFRAVGASANCALPMTILNAIVALEFEQFVQSVEDLKQKGIKQEIAIRRQLLDVWKKAKRIVFNGDGYAIDWPKNAAKRGLEQFKTTVDAVHLWKSEQAETALIQTKIYTAAELEALHHVQLEQYCQKVRIESQVMLEMVETQVIPLALSTIQQYLELMPQLKQHSLDTTATEIHTRLERLNKLIGQLHYCTTGLQTHLEKAEHKKKLLQSAKHLVEKVLPLQADLRKAVDTLEHIVDADKWPFAKYYQLLFIR
jgi:glutamine synthetase